MSKLQQYGVSNENLLKELKQKSSNPVTWCSIMDSFKSRAKRNDSDALLIWLNELLEVSLKRKNITEDFKESMLGRLNCWIGTEVYSFVQLKTAITTEIELTNKFSPFTVSMLLYGFYNHKESDFDMQLEVLQDMLLYKKVFER